MMIHLRENKFDVLIVGAGVTGCSIAYFLARKSDGNLKIGVIDKSSIGSESSAGAAGMIAAQIESESDSPFLRLALESRKLFDELSGGSYGLDLQRAEYVKSGILSIASDDKEVQVLKERMEWQKKIGLECEWWSPQQVAQKFSFLTSKFLGGFWVPKDGQISSNRLVFAFAEAARKMGVVFLENENLNQPILKESRLDFLETDNTKFFAEKFVFATGSWTGKVLNDLVPVRPVKGQILIFEIPMEWGKTHNWETPVYFGKTPGPEPVNCYFVPKKDGHLFLGATMEDCGFDISENEKATEKMADYACEIFPELSSFPFKSVWVGLRPGAPDQQPVFGLVPGFKNVYVASGHFRNGILLAPITGKIFAELILQGRSSFPLESFSPERFSKISYR